MVLPQLKLSNSTITSKPIKSSIKRLSTDSISMKQIESTKKDQLNQPSSSTLSIKVINSYQTHNPVNSSITSTLSSSNSNPSNPMPQPHCYETQETSNPTPHQTNQPEITNSKNKDLIEEHPKQESESEDVNQIFGSLPIGIIGKTKPRAIVRIERDYSAKGATSGRVQFWDGWVTELEGRITPLELQNTLNDLNGILASAYDPYKSILDNTLSVFTLYISPLIIKSHYKKEMISFNNTLNLVNQNLFNPVGLNILNPRKVAFLFLEIEYY